MSSVYRFLYWLAQHGPEFFRCNFARVAQVDLVVFARYLETVLGDELGVQFVKS